MDEKTLRALIEAGSVSFGKRVDSMVKSDPIFAQ